MFHSKKFSISAVLFLAVTSLSLIAIVSCTGTGSRSAIAKDNLSAAEASQGISAADSGSDEAASSAEVSSEDAPAKKPGIIRYIVKAGDTLDSIAKSYRIDVKTISESNRISQDISLKVGQELKFPSVVGVLYAVKRGDNLWDISRLYGLKMDLIASANGLKLSDVLRVNQQIILPGVDGIKAVSVSSSSKGSSSPKVSSRGRSYSGSVWPLVGVITSKFGPRWGRRHNGLDIAAKTGTLVRAFMGGTVIYSGWESGYGNLIKIDHGGGLVSYYGHNSKLLVSKGQQIEKGQTISKVGSTGDSTGPHLHFEIRRDGTPVNPLSYLK